MKAWSKWHCIVSIEMVYAYRPPLEYRNDTSCIYLSKSCLRIAIKIRCCIALHIAVMAALYFFHYPLVFHKPNLREYRRCYGLVVNVAMFS